MSKHLLAISIGPVQDFIAAARRTADLYAGSQLLVEVAKTIARTIQSNGGQLIFPAVVNKNGKQEISDGPNKILAEIISGDPKSIAQACREDALEYLRGDGQGNPGVWGEAKEKMKILTLDQPLADAQIESFLEFYAAWLPWDGNDNSYEKVRKELDRLLAGRKALRDFQQQEKGKHTKAGRPKSPLDPSRDCALDISRTQPVPFECQTDPLWLKKRETLDALSLLKRVRGNELKEVPSTSLMAARAILPAVKMFANQTNQKELLDALKNMEEVVGRTPAGIDMGDLMFPNRLQEEIDTLEEAQKNNFQEPRTEILQLLKNPPIAEWRKKILEAARSLGYRGYECPPYYAILVADGDKMGALIGELKDIEKHRKFSAALSRFAVEAEKIVNSHNGYLIYSGGDDVLALLPVNRALDCGATLALKFRSTLESNSDVKAVLDQMRSHNKSGGTLSVGIAIVHHMEPLLVSLDQARAAGRTAKERKPALAIALHPRGGEPLTVSEEWAKGVSVQNWHFRIQAFRDELSRGFPYELRLLARECNGAGLSMETVRGEAKRILGRKKGANADGRRSPSVANIETAIEQAQSISDLEELANKLTIARFLAIYPEVKS